MRDKDFENLTIHKGEKLRPFTYTGKGRFTKVKEIYTDTQIGLLKTLVALGKLDTGNDAPRHGRGGEYYKAKATFTIKQARAWNDKYYRMSRSAFLELLEFLKVGKGETWERSANGNIYKYGEKPTPWNYENKPEGLRRGRIAETWRLNRRPTVIKQIYTGGEWKAVE